MIWIKAILMSLLCVVLMFSAYAGLLWGFVTLEPYMKQHSSTGFVVCLVIATVVGVVGFIRMVIDLKDTLS